MIRRAAPLALLLAACSHAPKDGGAGASPAASASAGKRGGGAKATFPVDVLAAESKIVAYEVRAPGRLEAFERVQVTSRVAGAVDRVAFVEGQTVAKGDALVVIDAERFRLAVNSAQAALDKATASEEDARAMIARREAATASNPGLIPGEELATYKTRALTAKADAAVAREALRSAEVNLRDASVRAPLSGVIQTRTVETGQYVQPGYVMATLLRTDPMLLRFDVLPEDAPRIKPDMTLRFTLRESQREYQAHVKLVSAAADDATHMVAVTAQVDADAHKYWLRPGSFCDVVVPIDATRAATVVPRVAARPTERGFVAYVVEGGAARERPLVLGMSTADGLVEVRQGLAPGEQVVVRGAEALSEGARVKATTVTAADLAGARGADAAAGGADAAPAGSTAAPGASAGAADATRAPAPPPAGSAASPRRKRGGT